LRNNYSNNWKDLIYKYSPYLSANIDDCINKNFNTSLQEAKDSINKESSIDEVMFILRKTKKQLSTIAAINDLKGEWNDLEVMKKLSIFADFSVTAALHSLLIDAKNNAIIKSSNLENSGVSVIALGKLGGYELNYSSDIDIMVIFDKNKSPLVKKEDTQKFFIRLTSNLANFLEKLTKDGYVFRTDLRLRPDPGAMPLSVSLTTAKNYYTSRGQNWERAAMIKARHIAGDSSVGKDFLKTLSSWIWRKNLDFATIQDIHSIKRQINAKQKKANPAFNVKLGHGGIREIEFFVQTQQLIYGGREPSLRLPDTISALKELENTGHISNKLKDVLINAYLFLRQTEHRLQMQEDKQTHSLPINSLELENFAKFMNFSSADEFKNILKKHTNAVKTAYAKMFTESKSLSENGNLVFTGIEDDPETLETIERIGFKDPKIITAVIRGWHHGRYPSTRSEKSRQILTEIIPSLLKAFSKTPHPNKAFICFDNFLSRLPLATTIFSMFAYNPKQIELIAEIMGTSSTMAEHLAKNPEVLDGVLSKNYFGALPELKKLQLELENILKTANDYEDILNLARRFARDKHFHAGIHILKAITHMDHISLYLSNIAEASINSIIPYIIKEFEKTYGEFKNGEFTLLAMGSLAAKKFSFVSDIDLIAIYNCDKNKKVTSSKKNISPSLYYNRLMQKIISAISTPTSEGILYKIDTRLRPSGAAGAIAISFETFENYYKKNAWTWEYMSLIRSRVVLPDSRLKERIEKEIINILSKKRDKEKLRLDIIDMREKIEKEFGSKDKWAMKYLRGGMIDILFITQYLLLLNAGKLVAHANVTESIRELIKNNIIDKNKGKILIDSYNLFYDIRNFLKLTAELPFDEKHAPKALKTAMAETILKNEKIRYFKRLKTKINEHLKKSFDIYKETFSI